MKTYVFYHAHCADGFASAFAAWLALGEEDVTYTAVTYDAPMPAVEDGSRVFILDFSWPNLEPAREALTALFRRTRLLVIDHHPVAKELADLPFVVFDNEKSGCVLTWEYFARQHRLHPNVIPLLRYIQDRDLWQWRLPDSREVNAGLATYPFDFHVWKHLEPDGLCGDGIVALRMITQQARSAARKAWLQEIGGHTVRCVNATCYVSETGHEMLEMYPDSPFVALYRQGDGKREWSLRSRRDFDCSPVARAMGGGGHAQACGFTEEVTNVVGAGVIAIAAERERQQTAEGYTAEHDDTHDSWDLANAAECYLSETSLGADSPMPLCWPFEEAAWKPCAERRRNLVKAGALMAAAIDHLDRQLAAGSRIRRPLGRRRSR